MSARPAIADVDDAQFIETLRVRRIEIVDSDGRTRVRGVAFDHEAGFEIVHPLDGGHLAPDEETGREIPGSVWIGAGADKATVGDPRVGIRLVDDDTVVNLDPATAAAAEARIAELEHQVVQLAAMVRACVGRLQSWEPLSAEDGRAFRALLNAIDPPV